MKRNYYCFLPVTLLLLTAPSRLLSQERIAGNDSSGNRASQPLVTVAPLLGGVNLSYVMTPVSEGKNNFTINQVIVDESSPLYKIMKTKHPLLVRAGFRYQGLYLAGENAIGVNNFHALTIPVTVTYVISRNTNITGIVSAGIASDFRKNVTGSDVLYNAGARFGFRQSKDFRFGVTLIYSKGYAGNTLLPLPDFEWTISKKWKLEGLVPLRTSLKYRFNQTQTIALTQGFYTGAWRLNDASGVGKYIQLQNVNAGLMYEHVFNRRWAVNLIAGYTFSQKLQTFNNNQKIAFNDLGAMNNRIHEISYDKTAFTVQTGVSFKF